MNSLANSASPLKWTPILIESSLEDSPRIHDTAGELVKSLTHQPQSILISLISVRLNAL
ncbi:hypothetical protein NIES4072_47570 [Nostoc commune NIES-4072]|uniref:Uncharacterized protein n=1 Tax=Nostoc commune NIES-4072 TaxID=2005467 RepID=A0A2R5FS09_NOSCO|nr:hypothetical protein NIES4070_43350 [Nostoc commune HK-02]GBG21075.1 hypothetical protein NIES4072_47570 [Nostoc commune NIES-4072]